MNEDHRIRQFEKICRSQQTQLDAQLQRLNELTGALKKNGVDVPGMTVMLSDGDMWAMDVARQL
jgi:hypothetical protein